MALVFETAKDAVVDCHPRGIAVRGDISHDIISPRRTNSIFTPIHDGEREREKKKNTLLCSLVFTMFSQFRFYQWIKLRGIEK